MQKYRKKPVVIDAILFDGTAPTINILTKAGCKLQYSMEIDDKKVLFTPITIDTPEGKMTAQVGDFVIKGIKGEFYPCKPDIFKATYEKVS